MAPTVRRPDAALRAHGAVALMSLALCCLAFCAPNLLDAQHVPILLDQRAQAIHSVTLAGDQDQVQVLYQEGRATEVRVSAIDPNTRVVTPTGRYRAGPRAQELLGRLSPLKAQRALGMLDDAHLQSFGLKEAAQTHLRVDAGPEVLELTLGRALYGSGDLYALVDGRGVFVISGLLVRDLDRLGAALWETHLLPPEAPAAQRLTVTRNGRSRTFERGTEDGTDDFYEADRAKGAPSRLAKRLLAQSAALELFTAAAAPPSGEPAWALALFGPGPADHPVASLQIYAGANETVAVSAYQPSPMVLPKADATALEEMVAALMAEP